MKNETTQQNTDFDTLIQSIGTRLEEGKKIRRTLPGGRVHIDRQLPFLCVYRSPPDRVDPLTKSLVVGEASYLISSGEAFVAKHIENLVCRICKTLINEFGAFLILEIWSATEISSRGNSRKGISKPTFQIVSNDYEQSKISSTISKLQMALGNIKVAKIGSKVTTRYRTKPTPPGLRPLLSDAKQKESDCQLIGLEVDPIYRDPGSDRHFPLVLRNLHRGVTRALKHAFFDFVKRQTTQRPPNFQALGRRAMVKAVWEVDGKLADVGKDVRFLLQVTPINTKALWAEFRRKKYENIPIFYYRPCFVEPDLLKRKLWNIHIERLEDPTLEALFREKRSELDTQFTMLNDIETSAFRYGSLQLYGGVDDKLLRLAKDILNRIEPRNRDDITKNSIGAEAFRRHALNEIKYYRKHYPRFQASVEVRNDISSGLMVSEDTLLIGENTRIPISRIKALLQHEIGTHLLTYFNGRMQPFQQLYLGLAGYDELQEGLAVLSEYLVGGLSRPRLRVLAARVVACKCMLDGATFVETYRILSGKYHFEKQLAFIITVRIYRGGGLTKDIIYLRGLDGILSYIRKGGTLNPLFVGKIAANHVPIIRELQSRNILHEAPLYPRYMNTPEVLEKLHRLRQDCSILNLTERR